MFCIVGHVVIGFECIFVLFETHCEARPVCPTYAFLQSLHVNLYVPERVYLSGGWCWCISSFWMVLVVRKAIFRSVFLNRLVINVVSLPMYVKDIKLCVLVFVSLTNVVVSRLWMGGLCVWTGKPLLDRMSWKVSSSSLYSFSFRWYVLSLLYRNLIAAYLCWAGWFEEYGMIVSVKVGFLFMEVTQLVGVLWIVMSK